MYINLSVTRDIQFVKEILLAQLALSLRSMDPNRACHVLAHEDQLTPVFPSLGVALISGAGTERNGQTDNETKNRKQESADSKWVDEFRDTRDERGPYSDDGQRQDHLRKDGAVHPHEERPFGVLGHVARTNLHMLVIQSGH